MFGTVTLNTDARNWSWEVWSKTSEQTHPPFENGETTIIGTLTPRPIGPAMPPADDGRGSTVRYSPAVPLGGGGRRHVVEEAVVLVVHDEEDSVLPYVGIRREDVQDLLGVPLAKLRRSGRVFVIGVGGDDPRHLREGPVGDVLGEVVEFRVRRVSGRH